MWTKAIFEQAMAAEWSADDTHVRSGGRIILAALDGDKRHARANAALAVLGHSALALVLAHEWSAWEDWNGDGGFSVCPECSGLPPEPEEAGGHDDRVTRERHPERIGHGKGCRWGAVCDLARECLAAAGPQPVEDGR